jgi:16S rRNA (uracil1498-N3)-methyltransferase
MGRRLIIHPVARRVHIPSISPGRNTLTVEQAHHLRNVLRLPDGAPVELFDDSGQTTIGTLQLGGGDGAVVDVNSSHIVPPPAPTLALTVAAAVPKGDRAQWMVEKLSELGVARFVPLAAQRSVVLPGGVAKLQRWQRIAIESARQSRRAGVMQVSPLLALHEALPLAGSVGIVLSTDPAAVPLHFLAPTAGDTTHQRWIFIGPEGGWTQEELRAFETAAITAARLTTTILRIETAAIAAAAILLCAAGSASPASP